MIIYEHESAHKVKLGDNYQYPIRGSGKTSYNLDSEKSLSMKYVLYVTRLKKNILSNYSLDEKGIRVSFIYGQVLMWKKGKTIDDEIVIREEYEFLYKLKGQPEQVLVHKSIEPSLLWYQRLAHMHFRAPLMARKAVYVLPEIQEKNEGI